MQPGGMGGMDPGAMAEQMKNMDPAAMKAQMDMIDTMGEPPQEGWHT